MKKILAFILIVLCLLPLASCGGQTRGYFIEGSFYGESDGTVCALKVKSIDYETFSASKGINTVADSAKPGLYYEIELYVGQSGNEQRIDLAGLACKSDIGSGYADENGTFIAPTVTKDDYYAHSSIAYSIKYDGKTFALDNTFYHASDFKGLEAYCWQEEGEWVAVLMSGTNRFKTAEEVNSLVPVSLDEMKIILDTYGQQKAYTRIIPVHNPCVQEDITRGFDNDDAYTVSLLAQRLGLAASGDLTVDASMLSATQSGGKTNFSVGEWSFACSNVTGDEQNNFVMGEYASFIATENGVPRCYLILPALNNVRVYACDAQGNVINPLIDVNYEVVEQGLRYSVGEHENIVICYDNPPGEQNPVKCVLGKLLFTNG